MAVLKAEAVRRDLVFQADPNTTMQTVANKLNELGAKGLKNDNGVLRCGFGNYGLARLIGTAWVKSSILPKAVAVGFTPLTNGTTQATFVIDSIAGASLRVGVPKRMTKAFNELADQIMGSFGAN